MLFKGSVFCSGESWRFLVHDNSLPLPPSRFGKLNVAGSIAPAANASICLQVWMKFHLWPPWMRPALGMPWSCAFLARVLWISSVEFLHSGHAFRHCAVDPGNRRRGPGQFLAPSGECKWLLLLAFSFVFVIPGTCLLSAKGSRSRTRRMSRSRSVCFRAGMWLRTI